MKRAGGDRHVPRAARLGEAPRKLRHGHQVLRERCHTGFSGLGVWAYLSLPQPIVVWRQASGRRSLTRASHGP